MRIPPRPLPPISISTKLIVDFRPHSVFHNLQSETGNPPEGWESEGQIRNPVPALLDSRNLILKIIVNSRGCYSS